MCSNLGVKLSEKDTDDLKRIVELLKDVGKVKEAIELVNLWIDHERALSEAGFDLTKIEFDTSHCEWS